jgi:hypothetical protein
MSLEKDVAEIKQILIGDGKDIIGLCETVRNNTKRIKKIEADVIGKWIMRVLWGILAAGQCLLAYYYLTKEVIQ